MLAFRTLPDVRLHCPFSLPWAVLPLSPIPLAAPVTFPVAMTLSLRPAPRPALRPAPLSTLGPVGLGPRPQGRPHLPRRPDLGPALLYALGPVAVGPCSRFHWRSLSRRPGPVSAASSSPCPRVGSSLFLSAGCLGPPSAWSPPVTFPVARAVCPVGSYHWLPFHWLPPRPSWPPWLRGRPGYSRSRQLRSPPLTRSPPLFWARAVALRGDLRGYLVCPL